MSLLGRCGQRRCGCSFASDSIRVEGSGEPGDPLTFEGGFILPANAASRPLTPHDADHIFQLDTRRHYAWDARYSAWSPYDVSPWTSVTPTFSNLTMGTSVTQGKYRYEGDCIRYKGLITFESGFSITGNLNAILPGGLSSTGEPGQQTLGVASLIDASTINSHPLTPQHTAGALDRFGFVTAAIGTNFGLMNASNPVTIAIDDTLSWNIVVEVEA